MATQLDKETLEFDSDFFQQSLYPHYRSLLKKFRKNVRSFIFFNIAFFLVLFFEMGLFIYFAAAFSKSAFIAFMLGGLFLTSFSYLLLLFYFQAKKPEQLTQLLGNFIEASRNAVGIPKGVSEHHLSIAHAAIKLSSYLHDFEKGFYFLTKNKSIRKILESFSFFCHFEDVFKLKQILLKVAIDEHIKQIHMSPTDLEVHTSMANTYVLLSKLYSDSEKAIEHPFMKFRFKKLSTSLDEKFKSAAKRAIEEFTIINHYTPDDPWVHMQLAQSYRDLGMYEEEIREYEIILDHSPSDNQILFRLGVLYFEQGKNSKGLKIYEKLIGTHYKKAEDLISFYGSYRTREALLEV